MSLSFSRWKNERKRPAASAASSPLRVRTSGAAELQSSERSNDAEYVRRLYESTRNWYVAAEAKAQLLLTVNGALITIIFGTVFGTGSGMRTGKSRFGVDTWIFLGIFAAALASAICCAGLCLWSKHRRAKSELSLLGVDPHIPGTYRPEALWYFGHLAQLQPHAAIKAIRAADQNFEIEALSYNAVDLAGKVLRKHRWVNAGWAFTALALIAFTAAGASFFLQNQLLSSNCEFEAKYSKNLENLPKMISY